MAPASPWKGVGVYVVDPQAAERFADLVEWVAVLARTTDAAAAARIRDHVAPTVHAWEDSPREGAGLRQRLGVHAVIEQAETPDQYHAALALRLGRPRALVGLEMCLPVGQHSPWGWGWHGECYEGPNPNATPQNLAFRALVQSHAPVYVPVVGLGTWSEGANPPLAHYLDELQTLGLGQPHLPGWAIYNGDETPDSDVKALEAWRQAHPLG